MFRLPLAIVLSLISITACGRETPSSATPAQPAAEQPAQAQQQQPAEAAPQTTESEQATASQESSGEAVSEEDRSDAALERLAAMPADQQLPGGKWKVGTNYTPLVPAQPTNVAPGKIEVVEEFWYGCSHCNALEPFLANWQKNKPDYIEFVRVPVMWGPVHRAHARLFYLLQALNRTDLHQRVFDSIHKEGNMLVSNDEQATRKAQLDFLKAHGVSADDFNKAWDSFSVSAGLQRAEQLTQRYKVNGVPLIIINGKYTTDVGQAGGPGQLLQLINDLAANERRR
jgi:protein dithiol oxidoreductase (disulfide-forming)